MVNATKYVQGNHSCIHASSRYSRGQHRHLTWTYPYCLTAWTFKEVQFLRVHKDMTSKKRLRFFRIKNWLWKHSKPWSMFHPWTTDGILWLARLGATGGHQRRHPYNQNKNLMQEDAGACSHHIVPSTWWHGIACRMKKLHVHLMTCPLSAGDSNFRSTVLDARCRPRPSTLKVPLP